MSWALLGLMASGCSALNFGSAPSGEPYLESFLGVPFGASLLEVEQRYPNGLVESSPLGFSSYRLKQLQASDIHYSGVVYEFDGSRGMQIVVAEFSARSTAAVEARLRSLLGRPWQKTTGPEGEAETASWVSSNGSHVRFDRARHLLIVQNLPQHRYAEDIELRLQNEAAID